jgi:muconolactone delta-isomerase
MAQFMATLTRNLAEFTVAEFTDELLEIEAERARRLYADGIFRAMWSRLDVPGAVVLIEAAFEHDARHAVESLPLMQRGMLLCDSLLPLAPYRGFGPRGG